MQQDDSGPTMEELIDKVKQGNNLMECVYYLSFCSLCSYADIIHSF
jgi:hypothetical protein